MSRILDVYLHEQFAGKLIQDNSGRLQFEYAEKYLFSKESDSFCEQSKVVLANCGTCTR